MTSPVVNTLPSAPSRNQSPDAFVETADTWVAALPSWTTSVNTLGSWMNTTAAAVDADASTASTAASVAQTAASNAVNAPGTSATSTTPLTPSIASKSLTIQTGKSFSVGQFVVIADTANPTTNYMIGNITSYNSGTGALVVNVTNSAGVAASAWTISLTGAPAQNSLSNNLTFLGSGRRIYGDFSDSTLGNRLSFQSSIANGTTGIVVIPNGTSTQTSIVLTNNSDSNNASATFLSTTSAECQIGAAKTGTGSTLPLKFYTSGVPRFSLSPTESRFQADFSNATLSNRLLFQSSTVNNATSIGAIPNGTSSYANFTAFASSNPDQSALIQIAASSTEVIINSTRTGTASYLPLTFYTGGAQRLYIGSNGDIIQFNPAGSSAIYAVRATDASASAARGFYSTFQNEGGISVSSIVHYLQTDGSGLLDFYVTPAGSRVSDRRFLAWRINPNGLLLDSNQSMPLLNARLTSNQTTGGTVVFPTVDRQQGGSNYNSSTGVYTAPASGVYLVSFDLLFANDSGTSANFEFGISASGYTNTLLTVDVITGRTAIYSQTRHVYLSAGGTVQISVSPVLATNTYVARGNFNVTLLR